MKCIIWKIAIRPQLLRALNLCIILIALIATPSAWASAIIINFTSDTEGHVGPCQTCPMHAGFGSLTRRATVLKNLRQTNPDALLLDTGNFLVGSDSFDTRGKVIVAAYNALAYDAVNLSWRDFRFGKQITLASLDHSKFQPLSANLLDSQTQKPLVAPYLIRNIAGQRIAILGITEAPAGLDMLPYLQQQLAGLQIQNPLDAITAALADLKPKADAVILLYDGSTRGLRDISARFPNEFSVVLASGVLSADLPADLKPPVLTAEMHGKTITQVEITCTASQATITHRDVDIDPATPTDPVMDQTLAAFTSQPQAIFLSRAPPTTTTIPIAANTNSVNPQPGTPPATAPSAEASATPPPAISPVASASPPPDSAPAASAPPENPSPAVPHELEQPPDLPDSPLHIIHGLSDVGLTADQVNQAIDRGSAFLWNYLKTKDLKDHPENFGIEQYHSLCALALVHCDAQKRFPDFDAAVRTMLTHADPITEGIYRAGVLNMLIEAYGDPTFYPQLETATRFLLESEGSKGRFDYNGASDVAVLNPSNDTHPTILGHAFPITSDATPAIAWKRRSDPTPGGDGDNSVTQFAVLGLHTASRHCIHLPDQTWRGIINGYHLSQSADGGWGYLEGSASYGSMTCAGVCSTAIARYDLGEKNFTADPSIQRGLDWLAKNYSITKNPGDGGWLYYYLYSLERTGRILQTDFIGNHQWYAEGASFLINTQKNDGSWIGEDSQEQDPRLATSFALLFLTRATPTLNNPALETDGLLRTFAIAPIRHLYIILDCSGSMIDMKQGKQKFAIARDAVSHLIETLPKDSQVALRVYGHRKTALDPDCDLDTELKIPMDTLDQKVFGKALAGLRARGKTPLALSLQLAKQDIGTTDDPVEVLLLTDGGEDTLPRRDPVKAAADLVKTPNVTLDIVGFDIKGHADWKKQLVEMSRRAKGGYWPADDIADLDDQVRAAALAMPDEFQILDSTGQPIRHGRFGTSQTMPPGQYTLRTKFGTGTYNQPFNIQAGQQTGVTFDASRMKK